MRICGLASQNRAKRVSYIQSICFIYLNDTALSKKSQGDSAMLKGRKSQAKNAVLFQQTILRYFVHFGQHEKATRQSPAGSLCFIVLFLCYFRVLCVRFSLKYERTGAARPPPPSTRPAPCSHSARLKPSLGSCSSRFGFARSPPVIPRRASSLSGATAE